MKIKEVIVVEGRHDTSVLQQYFDCDTIETNGLSLSEETLRLIEEARDRCGVIIFTDPDHPGEYIRRRVNEAVPGCKNAFIEKDKAKTPKKVGVEHASRAVYEFHAGGSVSAFGDCRDDIAWQFRRAGRHHHRRGSHGSSE